MEYLLLVIGLLNTVALVISARRVLIDTFKIGYYEQKLKNLNVDIEHVENLNNHAVSISGFHQHQGEDVAHVVSPQTKQKIHLHQLVQIVNQCPEEAEVLSTALMLAHDSEHHQILSQFKVEKLMVIPLKH